ncbi:MAG: serine hydrolase [Isosphaeraceae bacterium]
MANPPEWSDPGSAGLDPGGIARLDADLKDRADRGEYPSIAWCGGRDGRVLEPRFFGRLRRDGSAPPGPDSLFLVASITKPIVVAGAMRLVERGLITLDDPLVRWIPEFDSGARDRREVTVRHLMTHTSGLPDQLPRNAVLRAAHCPLSAFVEETCRQPLLFAPGTAVRYQSMGTLMLAAVIRKVSGLPTAEFLAREIFAPLGMDDTCLGLGNRKRSRVAELRVAPEMEKVDWNWNSDYWLGIGSPWGGLLTTPADLARFALAMLDENDCRAISRPFDPGDDPKPARRDARSARSGTAMPPLGPWLAARLARPVGSLRRPRRAQDLRPLGGHRVDPLDRSRRAGLLLDVHERRPRRRVEDPREGRERVRGLLAVADSPAPERPARPGAARRSTRRPRSEAGSRPPVGSRGVMLERITMSCGIDKTGMLAWTPGSTMLLPTPGGAAAVPPRRPRRCCYRLGDRRRARRDPRPLKAARRCGVREFGNHPVGSLGLRSTDELPEHDQDSCLRHCLFDGRRRRRPG